MIDVSYHSLRNLVTQENQSTEPSTDEEDDEETKPEDGHPSQVQLWKGSSGDTATWLYDLVFSSTTEADHMASHSSEAHATIPETTHSEGSEDEAKKKSQQNDNFNSLVPWRKDQPKSLSLLIKHPISSTLVVTELLSEWTTLTEDEIEGRGRPQEETIQEEQGSEPHLQFKDAVGRTFAFPWHIARTWVVSTWISSS